MDLHFNQETSDSPQDSVLGLGSLLTELETAHGRIEERIRQLEAVTSRARQRQRWRQSLPATQTLNISNSRESTAANVHGDDTLLTGEVGITNQQRSFQTATFGKRDSSHLIAKALGMDTDPKMARSDNGCFFDCNICLDMARDPILTCCGHLFCWPCFYQLSYTYSNVKECPVCMEEVTDTSIIPIYGNGSGNDNHKFKLKESGLKVPPRPQAHRIESIRQQLINHGAFSSPIQERIQQFSNMIIATGDRTRSQDLDIAPATAERTNMLASQFRPNQVLPATDTQGSQPHLSFQVSRLLLQGAASFSSLSSALNSAMDSAERLVEDLEAFIQSRHVRPNHQQSSSVVDGYSSPSFAAVTQTPDSVAYSDSTALHSASSFRIDSAATVVQFENRIMDTAVESNPTIPISSSLSGRTTEVSRLSEVDPSIEINSTVHYSSSSRGRTGIPRVSDLDDRPCREPRRRRLR